jgi:hypothetical protein
MPSVTIDGRALNVPAGRFVLHASVESMPNRHPGDEQGEFILGDIH